MSIFSKVTLKTLRKNRVRTAVTVIGIILSAAMITAVTTSLTSLITYLQDVMEIHEGLWHGAFYNMPVSDLERLETDERFDSAACAQIVGWAVNPGITGGGAVYYEVLGCDDTFFERMPIRLTDGRLPESPDEIVLRSKPLSDIHLGDEITLDLGERYLDGGLLGSSDWWMNGEELRVRESRTYTVVGFCERTSFESESLPGSEAFTYRDNEAETEYLECYWLLKDPNDTFDFMREFSAGAYRSVDNSDYLMTLGASRYGTYYSVLYGFAAILIGLIMFGSVSLIYNAFSISVAERTRQFGLLRSVGATKKQLRSMVFTEAMAVSAVGLPLGILAGLLGMAVTFRFIGRALGDVFMSLLVNVEDAPSLTFRVTPAAIVAALAIGLVTVLISAWIPSRRATRVTAIEAIRQNQDVKVERREVKTSPLTYRVFGLEGAIASKHFKRNRRRYRATVVSLFMSVVLFISASSFCRYMTDTVEAVYDDYDYDTEFYGFYDKWEVGDGNELEGNIPSSRMGEVLSVLSSAPTVTDSSAMMRLSGSITLTEDIVPEDEWRRITGSDGSTAGSSAEGDGDEQYYAGLTVLGVEESTYRAYLAENGLPEDEYMGEHPKIIVRALRRHFNSETERVETHRLLREDLAALDIPIFDEAAEDEYYRDVWYKMTEEERETAERPDFEVVHTYEIGAFLDGLPMGANSNYYRDGITVLMPAEELSAIELRRYDNWDVYLRVSDRENGLASVMQTAKDAGLELREDRFFDVYEASAQRRGMVQVVRIISCGFIALISAIAAANVFNTVSTNILLRRREFAMLRSVGMTNRGFNRMMNFECVLYGTKSLLYGIPASLAVTYLIYRTVMTGMDTGFYVPWAAVAAAVGSVFLVVFLSMMYSMAGIKRDDPIEAMRNEAT